MSSNPNDLTSDFPGREQDIHTLKTTNGHFARLFESYDELNRTIHRMETRVEPTTDEVEEEMKRRRVRIKDEILTMLDGGNP